MPNKKITKKKVSKKKTTKKKKFKVDPENPIPAALQKTGIKKVTDNISEGSALNVSAGVFMAFFGNDLLEHYSKENAKGKDKK